MALEGPRAASVALLALGAVFVLVGVGLGMTNGVFGSQPPANWTPENISQAQSVTVRLVLMGAVFIVLGLVVARIGSTGAPTSGRLMTRLRIERGNG